MSKTLNAGVIGLGVGERHIYGYNSVPGCRTSIICDINEDKLNSVGNRTGVPRLPTDPSTILSDPDVDIVSIASFDEFHSEQVIQALNAGKHVFVEKPLCLTQAELSRIDRAYRASRARGLHLKLSTNFILRMEERFIKLREKISDGKLGEIYAVEGSYDYGRMRKLVNGWRGSTKNYSIMHGGGIHIIDLLQWLTGEKYHVQHAISNKASTKNSAFIPHDNIISIGRFGKSITGKISANFGSQTQHFHQIRVYGTKGTFIQDCGDARYYFDSEPETILELDLTKFPSSQKGDLIPEFVRSIINNTPCSIEYQDVVNVMKSSIAIENLCVEP